MSVREQPLEAIVSGDELRAPAPGYFRLGVRADHLVVPGDVIGELEVLGRTLPVVAAKLRGLAKLPPGPALARRPVSYGDTLLTLSTDIALGATDTAASQTAAASHGLVFKAPTSGRFYGRPGPDKPAFVETGAEITTGTTVCLLEVMKTFHRVTFGGADVPARARVKEVLVTDGADVNQGDPLLALESL
jgi:acetyl-CoA carboxylase biotin carboxyl carrier protein